MIDIRPRPASGSLPEEPEAQPATVLAKGYLPSDVNAANTDVGFYINKFPAGDIDTFSVSRYAYAQARQRYFGEGSGALMKYAPWEAKYYQALDRVAYKAQGEYVSIVDGGALAPEAWSSQWSYLLRAFGALDQLPVTKLNVPYRIAHLPKVSADVTITYPGENVPIPATQFQFGQTTYTARKAAATLPVSNELLRDAPQLADQVLRNSTARAIAYDRDYQALLGQGGPMPTGLVTMATAGTIAIYYPGSNPTTSIATTPGATGFTPSFLQLSQLRGKVHQLNGSPNAPATGQAHCNGMIAHSRFEQTVLTQGGTATGPWTDANGRPLWMSGLSTPDTRATEDKAADGALLGQIWVLTNILPTNAAVGSSNDCSYIVAGWWEMFALFDSLQLAYDTTMEASYFANDQTGIRILHRWDAGVLHPEAFAVMAGVRP